MEGNIVEASVCRDILGSESECRASGAPADRWNGLDDAAPRN